MYRIGRYDTASIYHIDSKPVQIPPLFHIWKNTGHTGEYRSFRVESKNRPVQKASYKKKKKKEYQMAPVAFRLNTTLLVIVNI